MVGGIWHRHRNQLALSSRQDPGSQQQDNAYMLYVIEGKLFENKPRNKCPFYQYNPEVI